MQWVNRHGGCFGAFEGVKGEGKYPWDWGGTDIHE